MGSVEILFFSVVLVSLELKFSFCSVETVLVCG